jgi:hypothetical protein
LTTRPIEAVQLLRDTVEDENWSPESWAVLTRLWLSPQAKAFSRLAAAEDVASFWCLEDAAAAVTESTTAAGKAAAAAARGAIFATVS